MYLVSQDAAANQVRGRWAHNAVVWHCFCSVSATTRAVATIYIGMTARNAGMNAIGFFASGRGGSKWLPSLITYMGSSAGPVAAFVLREIALRAAGVVTALRKDIRTSVPSAES